MKNAIIIRFSLSLFTNQYDIVVNLLEEIIHNIILAKWVLNGEVEF